jgi:hypothetical protein
MRLPLVTPDPDAFAGLARRCGFADGGRHVRQRDTIPADLWTRADSLRSPIYATGGPDSGC